ncbi:MAG: sensor histidine kinase [Lachnospiraceae bacterium]
MVEWIRKFLYRIFCVLALLVSVYLIVDFLISGTFDYRVFLMFLLMVVVIIWGIADWRKSYLIMQKQETEIKLYQHYVQPLEELVMRQSAYITEVIRNDDSRQYLPLLRISDKVLAGFLYSKIVRAPSFVKTEVEVKSLEIISGISEHHLIEIIGTLVDNAYEACTEEKNQVMMEVDSENDRLVFSIKNQIEDDRLSEIGHFFEKGYSTKDDAVKHGLGLYNAKILVRKYKGDIFVCTDKIKDKNYLCMRVVV